MEQKQSIFDVMEEIVKKDGRYEMEAYNFVLLAFNYTMANLKSHRHVAGKELLECLKEYALDQYGPMVRTVFSHWGIYKCSDIGEIVFNLVDHGLLGKSDSDSVDDFKDVFDFEEVFDKPFTS